MRNILEIKDLRVSFFSNQGWVEVVSGVSISVPERSTVGIVGESGCGKTVTALSVMRLIPEPPGKIEGGEILFNGIDLLKLSDRQMRAIRGNRISMIFQEPISSLNPVFTVGEQIGEAIRAHNRVSRKEERERVIELLKLVKIPEPEKRLNSYPHELSGGMCQRVMIAMALSCNPELLIADEPTTALDVTIQAGILELLNELKEKMGMSILLITHDLGIVAEIADEVYVMYAGKIVEHALTVELFNNPRHPYTVGLMESIPGLHDTRKKLRAIPGIVPSPLDFPKGCRFQDRCSMVIDKCRVLEPPVVEFDNRHFSLCFRAEEVGQGN
ncbi:MAG: dipeptide/oligopeptide/nickel ABC transporter ATP-binding protein [Deltaproteobacteria bacterium]|nr:MAG: dipeptide/oligopeptide/nickel ABC transporter ATP-binding protein [Deltaproteobacteria bacterium]